MPAINPQRLLSDLHQLRSFGAHHPGVVRPSLSEVDMASRHWLAERMVDAGLEPEIDGVANVIGRAPRPGPALLVGSHSDTQPRGGWLDGALGVIYGLEVARALSEDPATAHLAIEPVSWTDEEGTFLGCLGSRSFCGVLEAEAEAQARDASGTPLGEALRAAGVAHRPRARLDRERYVGYLEAHIEQGPHLEDTGKRIGVVTSIVGIRGYTVHFTGEQNHAGTTPMPRRRDAGVALFEFAVRLREAFQDLAGDASVWTIGNVTLDPGAASIIPGAAHMILQFRDPDDARLQRMAGAVESLAARMSADGPVQVEARPSRAPVTPTIMDAGMQAHIAAAAEALAPGAWMHMPSAAGHDPMVISHHLPCAMLFVPSINGISHDFAEDTGEDDIVLGCQVLAEATARIGLAAQG